MLSKDKLVNVLVFLERVPPVAVGQEAYAWVETHQAVAEEIKRLESDTEKTE